MKPKKTARSAPEPIVSAAHLVQAGGELNEFEYGLIVASHAFERWMVRCLKAAGGPDLGPLDVLVLHTVYHRERKKRLADICFVLNVEDTHTVVYSLKKLQKHSLVECERQGKESAFGCTAEGQALCQSYRDIRRKCLVESFDLLGESGADIHELAARLRTLSGLYDQAARSAASF